MRQALILGAVNSVGCRLAEALCDRGVKTVALVDDWRQAPRLARLPSRMIEGGAWDGDALRRAMEGCDVVFHCAEYDRRFVEGQGQRGVLQSLRESLADAVDSAVRLPRRNVRSIKAVLSAASQSEIQRLIYLNAATGPTASERTALHVNGRPGLSVIVLRPATLYGPFCPWTMDAIRALRQGRRLRGGYRPCLYLDHLVEAILLAVEAKAFVGVVFPLHDHEPNSCNTLLDAHAKALLEGIRPPYMSGEAAGNEPPTDADIEKARRVLGYSPKTGFAQNMERTAEWIRWSGL